MSLGQNLQYLRRLRKNMTQEALAERLSVSRQTISKWELDNALPEFDKAIALCTVFHCSLDNLFREDMAKRTDAYSDLRVEEVAGFRYIPYTVVSPDPESDALDRVARLAGQYGIKIPRLIGWDFPCLSQEQINVYHLHGYTAAWVLPDGVTPANENIREQPTHKYAAIHIEHPFDDPFVTIPAAYRTLDDFVRVNGLRHVEGGVIPCFETAGDTMDVYIACK